MIAILKKIEEEYQEVLKNIEWLKSVLADEGKIFQIIKEELTAVREKFGDDRRTRIMAAASMMDVEDLIAEEDMAETGLADFVPPSAPADANGVQTTQPVDACPHQAIVALFAEVLPSARQVRDWTPARQQLLAYGRAARDFLKSPEKEAAK